MKTQADGLQTAENLLLAARKEIMETPWREDNKDFLAVVVLIERAVSKLRKAGNK